jgi:hypothetical protein
MAIHSKYLETLEAVIATALNIVKNPLADPLDQPSGGRTTQNSTPLVGPTCLGAQTCAPPSGATTLLILSLGTDVHSPSTLTS